MLAFLMRESLELRAANLPSHWKTEPVSRRTRPYTAHGHNSCVADESVMALEVNYGLILLTSDGGQEDVYERVGVFKVYGKEVSSFQSRKETHTWTHLK